MQPTQTEPYRTVPSRAEPYRTMQWKSAITSLAHHGTVPHRPLDCFYSNKNKFVQIEDSKIKTERGC